MTTVQKTAAVAASLTLCACGALLGNAFDDLQPVDTGDAAQPDAGSDAAGDAQGGQDARADAPHDAGPGPDAGDGGPDADSAGISDGDGAPDPWSASSSPYLGTADPYFQTGGGLCALSRIDGTIDTFTIGFDGNLWSAGWLNPMRGGWHTAYQVPPNTSAHFISGGGVSVVSPDEHYIYVYSLDQNGVLYQAGTWHDEVWSAATLVQDGLDAAVSTHLVPGGQIAAIARDEQNVVVATLGWDGYVWTIDEKDGVWGIAVLGISQDERFKVGGGIAAIAPDAQRLETFTIAPDGTLWSAGIRDGEIWTPGKKLTTDAVHFAPGAAIAATYRNGVIEVWTVGDDQQLWNAGTFDGVAWHDGYKVPVPNEENVSGAGGIGAALFTTGTLEIYSIGFDAHLWNISTRAAPSANDE